MAAKGNKAVEYNKDMLSEFAGYTYGLLVTVEEIVQNTGTAFSYLLAEENVSGADAETFIESVKYAQQLLTTVLSKVQQVDKIAKNICINVGVTASKADKSLEERRQDLGAAVVKVKESGK